MSISELADLVRKAQAGDPDALAGLLKQVEPMVYYTALKMVGNVHDAEDLTQEAYIRLLEALPTLRDPITAPKWVKQIVVNLCRNHWKKKRPDLFRTDEEEDAVLGGITENETAAVPDAYMEMAAKRQIITGMIDALPEKQNLTVYLYYYDELSVEEIAQLMEVSAGTVKSRLSTARATLRAQVEAEERKGNKLYVIFPFLGRLLQEEAESLPAPPVPPALLESAVQRVAGTAAKSAAGKAAAGLGVKIAAGVTAAAIVTGAAVGIALSQRGGAPRSVPAAAVTVLPTAGPVPTAAPTPSPTAAPEATPTPAPSVEPQPFDPAALLGGSIDDLLALRGGADTVEDYGPYRQRYTWGAPWMTADVETATGTVESLNLPPDVTLLGIAIGDSEESARQTVSGYGPNYLERDFSTSGGGSGVLLYNATEDHGLVVQVSCNGGVVVSIQYERDTYVTYGRDSYVPS